MLHYQLFSSVTILGPLAVTTLFFLKLGILSNFVHPQQFQFLLVSGPIYIFIYIYILRCTVLTLICSAGDIEKGSRTVLA